MLPAAYEQPERTDKLGPLWFTPGVTGPNLATMLFAAFGTMATISFMSFMQPYVLTELLQIPEEEQGRLTGNLHAFQESRLHRGRRPGRRIF